MDKMDNILDYFMGTKAYALFLLNYFYDDVRDDFILDERNIMAAKVGFISNILLGIKEGLVSQDENGSYSRLYENVLEESVLDIATKKDDGYVIDGYYFPNAASVVTEIRNRIAHGNFVLDLDHNRIILSIREDNVSININKLSAFICNSIKSYIKLNNSDEYKRDIIISRRISPNRKKPIATPSELRGLLRSFRKVEFTLKRKDGNIIEKCYQNLLEKIIKGFSGDATKDSTLLNSFKELVKDGYDFDWKYVSMNNIDFDIYAKELINIIPKDIPYDKQVYAIGFELQRRADSKYTYMNPIISNIKNLVMLEEIYENGTTNGKVLEKKITKDVKLLYNNYDSLVSASFAAFNSLFSYAIDDIYKNNNKYTNLDNNGLDYSKLDLSDIKIEKLSIDNTLYNTILESINDKKKLLTSKIKKINDVNNNIKIVNSKGNTNAYNKLSILLNNLINDKNNIANEISSLYNNLISIESYNSSNYDYLRNEAIINGIRNSIAHGDYRVIFNNNISDTLIIFENIYNNEVTFKAEVKILDFIILLGYNSPVVINFINDNTFLKKLVK